MTNEKTLRSGLLGLVLGLSTSVQFLPQEILTQQQQQQLVSVSISTNNNVNSASAFLGLGGEREEIEKEIKNIAKIQERVVEVQNMLLSRELRGGNEDSQVVRRYKDTYYDPSIAKMMELAPKLKLDSKKQERVELLPLLLKGHYLELDTAITKKDAKEQLEEMTEAADTMNEFLTLAADKYTVPKIYIFDPSGYKPERDYGPFACEFWGRERLAGSNKCVPKGEY